MLLHVDLFHYFKQLINTSAGSIHHNLPLCFTFKSIDILHFGLWHILCIYLGIFGSFLIFQSSPVAMHIPVHESFLYMSVFLYVIYLGINAPCQRVFALYVWTNTDKSLSWKVNPITTRVAPGGSPFPTPMAALNSISRFPFASEKPFIVRFAFPCLHMLEHLFRATGHLRWLSCILSVSVLVRSSIGLIIFYLIPCSFWWLFKKG